MPNNQRNHQSKSQPFKFNEISLEQISFKYPNAKKYTLSDINLQLSKGEKLAIIGLSGAGKSTFLDLISGLLEPNIGKIKVNNKDINSKNNSIFKKWQNSISYIPQTIFISNDTIKNNITFGSTGKINETRLNEVIDKVYLRDLIDSLPYKENTKIGESGLILSGGQRQRLAIADHIF